MEVFQYRATCPECVDGPWYTSDEEWKFCPVCGAHMDVEREVLGYNSLTMEEALELARRFDYRRGTSATPKSREAEENT